MASRLTFTGPTGPGNSVTSLVFQNVVNVNFQIAESVIEVQQSDPNKITHLDFSPASTVTYTKVAAGDSTIVVS